MKHAHVVTLLLLIAGLTSPASADQATRTAVLQLKTATGAGARSLKEKYCMMVAAKAETDARAKNSNDPVGAAEAALKNCRAELSNDTGSIDPKPVN